MLRKEWEYHFATLNQDQRNDSFVVIEFYCGDASLFETRKKIYDLFSAALASNELADPDDSKSHANWLFFVGNTLQLIEAAYLIEKMRSENRLSYIITADSTENDNKYRI